jgi:sec-independent protein translocase protein TatC
MMDETGTTPEAPESAQAAPESEGAAPAVVSEEGASSPGDAGTPPPAADADASSEAPASEIGEEMTLMGHLEELRRRMVRCLIAVGVGFALCYAFAERLLAILLKPLLDVLPPQSKLIATTLPEQFFTVLKMSLVAGFFVSSPYIFYHLWKFVAPGLYREERRMVIPVALASAFFFVGGATFGYFFVFPYGFKFFVEYAGDFVTIMPTISSYFSFATMMLIAFGLVFELPVFILFLSRLGLVTAKSLRKFRRWAILLSFIVGAILTPADPVSQCLMSGPMIILYEVGILAAAMFGKKKKEAPAEEAPAEENAAA